MADEAMWRRPKADDDEEELLRQQEEFLKAKQQPSVKMINLKDPASSASKVRSRFSSLRQFEAKRDVVSTSRGSGEVINPAIKDKIEETKGKLEDMVHNIPAASSNIILGNIMERKFDITKYKFNDNRVPTAAELGFPEVFGSDDMSPDMKKVCLNETCFCYFFMPTVSLCYSL